MVDSDIVGLLYKPEKTSTALQVKKHVAPMGVEERDWRKCTRRMFFCVYIYYRLIDGHNAIVNTIVSHFKDL